MPAYGLVDLSGGAEKNGMNIQFIVTTWTDKRGQVSRFEQCTVAVCQQPYIIPTQPRTYGDQVRTEVLMQRRAGGFNPPAV